MDDRAIGAFDSGIVYVGDTGRYPYGPRPQAQVTSFAAQITTKLIEDHDVKIVVVAGNTAAAAALEVLRFDHDTPLIGVIGTIASGAYQRAVSAEEVAVQLTCAACPGFVEFVERGDTRSDQVPVLAERLLAPVQAAGVHTLLLGCTHYPFLARTIGEVMGRDVVLVSSADETAFEVRAILSETFRERGRRLFGPEIDQVERWDPR